MIEKLAEEVHLMWVRWAKELMKTENFTVKRKKRWIKLFIEYKNLSEKQKNTDRRIAKKFIKIIKTEIRKKIEKEIIRDFTHIV